MRVDITKAQLVALRNIVEDEASLCGQIDDDENQKRRMKEVKLALRFLDKANGRKPK